MPNQKAACEGAGELAGLWLISTRRKKTAAANKNTQLLCFLIQTAKANALQPLGLTSSLPVGLNE